MRQHQLHVEKRTTGTPFLPHDPGPNRWLMCVQGYIARNAGRPESTAQKGPVEYAAVWNKDLQQNERRAADGAAGNPSMLLLWSNDIEVLYTMVRPLCGCEGW
jgi:hypothetical protein